MNGRNDIEENKARWLEELAKSSGNISIACKNTGISRMTYYRYLSSDEQFNNDVADVQESLIDHVEDKLRELIDGVEVVGAKGVYKKPPDVAAICFFLKCKAKKRGYVERQEHGFDKETLESLASFLGK